MLGRVTWATSKLFELFVGKPRHTSESGYHYNCSEEEAASETCVMTVTEGCAVFAIALVLFLQEAGLSHKTDA